MITISSKAAEYIQRNGGAVQILHYGRPSLC